MLRRWGMSRKSEKSENKEYRSSGGAAARLDYIKFLLFPPPHRKEEESWN
jgi:hypothetical protein